MAGKRKQPPQEPKEVTLRRLNLRYRVWTLLALVPLVAVLWIPLRAVVQIAEALSGKRTTLTITISVAISIAITVAATSGFLAMLRKHRAQGLELQRLRDRCNKLEGRLEAFKEAGAGQRP